MSHMQRVRMSRKVHEVPRKDTTGGHPSGKAGNTGLDNGQQLHAPKKHRAFKVYELTPTPTPPAEVVDHGVEGPPKSHEDRHKS